MLIVVIFLFSGILIGCVLQNKESIIRITERLSTWFIYLFLFLLVISVGANEEVIKNFGRLCVQAIILAFGAILGSVISAYFVYRVFFKKSQ